MRRADFPYLQGHPEVSYLDSAATCLVPQQVISALNEHLGRTHGSVGRSHSPLGEAASKLYEETRQATKHFLGASSDQEVIFTSGATDSLNLVAFGLAPHLKPGDEVLIDEGLHHSALLPWKAVCQQTGASLVLVPAPAGEHARGDRSGEIAAAITPATRVVVVGLINNVTGQLCTPAPLAGEGRWVIVDASQALAHFPLNLTNLGADAIAASTHKAYGLTGLGILAGSRSFLELLSPLRLGGGMVDRADQATWKPLPERLEAGSPNLDSVAGWKAAMAYMQELGMETISAQTKELTSTLVTMLEDMPGIALFGSPDPLSGLAGFSVDGWHPHDVGDLLARQGVYVRAGHHCAQLLHQASNLPGTVRASIGVHTSHDDISRLQAALHALPR